MKMNNPCEVQIYSSLNRIIPCFCPSVETFLFPHANKMSPRKDLANESECLPMLVWRMRVAFVEMSGVPGKPYLLINKRHLQSLVPCKRMELSLRGNHPRGVHLLGKTQFPLEQTVPDS